MRASASKAIRTITPSPTEKITETEFTAISKSTMITEVRTRRSTERSTARLFQGRPSLTSPQTCQAPRAAHSGSPVTSTFEFYSSDGLNETIFDSITDPKNKSGCGFFRTINQTISRRFSQNIPEAQITTTISPSDFLFPTEMFLPLMIAEIYSAQAMLHTVLDNVHNTRTRRSTERSTARFFQGSPSLTRSQTCQHHTPIPVDRR